MFIKFITDCKFKGSSFKKGMVAELTLKDAHNCLQRNLGHSVNTPMIVNFRKL